MLQQTTTPVVERYFAKFISKWPTVNALASASVSELMSEWAGLGYYARARNLLECARTVSTEFAGKFPEDTGALQGLPGIGPYTAAAIASIAFGKSAVVIDTNVERVIARYFCVETVLPRARGEIRRLAATLTPDQRPGDYAQAIMDLGATVCRPRNPDCVACPWSVSCMAYKSGKQDRIPVREKSAPKPVRTGILFVGMRDDGAWLLERRPPSGLLGGMLGWPGSEWDTGRVAPQPCAGNWKTVRNEVRHTFTHFKAVVRVKAALLPACCSPVRGEFIPADAFNSNSLPVLMKKAHSVVLEDPRFPQCQNPGAEKSSINVP